MYIRISRLFIVGIMILPMMGCKTKNLSFEFKRVEECRKNWVYSKLIQPKKIRVLYKADKTRLTGQVFPSYIIGLENNDTICLLVETRDLRTGQIVEIYPSYNFDIEIVAPIFTVFNKAKRNNIFCSVKEVYFDCEVVEPYKISQFILDKVVDNRLSPFQDKRSFNLIRKSDSILFFDFNDSMSNYVANREFRVITESKKSIDVRHSGIRIPEANTLYLHNFDYRFEFYKDSFSVYTIDSDTIFSKICSYLKVYEE